MRTNAIVVFSGQTDFWWQRLLRPGYRHCGVMIECGDHWVVLEPLAARLEVRIFTVSSPDALKRALRRRQLLAVETEVQVDAAPALFPGLFTCVEAVKRALGIRAVWVQTPWQLHKNLKLGKKTLT